jgi:hypothetical protein
MPLAKFLFRSLIHYHAQSRARSAFRIEHWDDRDTHVEELIAVVGDHFVARAAFDEAVRRRLGKLVTLRQKTRLLADSRRSDPV